MIRNYVKLHSSIWTNPKFLGLSSDAAKLAYIRCISAGNESEPNGQWIDRDYLAAAIGPEYALFIPELVAATLLVEDEDEVVRLRQWRLWQGRDRWSVDELAPDKAEARRRDDAERQKRKYHHDRGLHDLCKPGAPCRRGGTSRQPHENLTKPHGLLNERSSLETSREVASAAATLTSDASEEGVGSPSLTSPATRTCPVHGRTWLLGRAGWHCPTRAADGEAANKNGWCSLTPDAS